jgi:hypothetical protein
MKTLSDKIRSLLEEISFEKKKQSNDICLARKHEREMKYSES